MLQLGSLHMLYVSTHSICHEKMYIMVYRLQEEGYAGAETKRDPNSANRRKRGRAKRPTKASVAASGVASGDGTGTGPTGAAAVSAATGSALSQRRKYIMNLTEARSIGKRPSPMFTNFCYFKAQDARVLPLERLPAAQVRRAGKQGCGVAIVGMVYPRLTTSSEAVARLALEPLKWRGMLENCVSIAQARLSLSRAVSSSAAIRLGLWSCACERHFWRSAGRARVSEARGVFDASATGPCVATGTGQRDPPAHTDHGAA